MDDFDLLQSYAHHRSEEAFSKVVEQYIDLVYSAALRQVRDPHAADDITQAVFLVLARKAASLRKGTILPGWLIRTTRFTAANYMRRQGHRARAERLAMETTFSSAESEKLWQDISPALDEALAALSSSDRDALALRFFQKKSFRDIGSMLGLSDDAAQKRVSRALDKLRHGFARQRRPIANSLLVAALTAYSVQSAPPALHAAVLGHIHSAATAGIPTLVAETLHSLAWPRMRWIAAGTALLVAVTAIPAWQVARRQSATGDLARSAIAPPAQPVTTAPAILEPHAPTNDPRYVIRVVDADTRTGIPGAKLAVHYSSTSRGSESHDLQTDNTGEARLPVPKLAPLRSTLVFVTPPGYVPKAVSSPTLINYPDGYEMRMEKAATIAGVVRNESGFPVADVAVTIDTHDISYETGPDHIAFGSKHAVATTDVSGRWSLNHVPKTFPKATVYLTHPDYMVTRATILMRVSEATNAALVIQRGGVISGSVTDTNKEPIVGAAVSEFHNYGYQRKSTTTGADGRFVLSGVKTGNVEVVVQAGGFSPDISSLHLTNVQEVSFTLGRGHQIHGRVVDQEGNAIPGARVATDSDNQGYRKVPWSTNTDSAGRFEWDSAPDHELLYAISAEGFAAKRSLRLAPEAEEHEIKLVRPNTKLESLSVTGKVSDAESGQPIPAFKVWLGGVDRMEEFPSRSSANAPGRNGRFEVKLAHTLSQPYYRVIVEAEGYAPAASPKIRRMGTNAPLTLQLRRGAELKGVVLGPDEEPVANASVFQCVSKGVVYMDGPAHVRMDATKLPATTTGADGTFSTPVRVDLHSIVAVHDSGYAEVSAERFSQSSTIRLEPWGRAEGILLVEGKPAASETVLLYNAHSPSSHGIRMFPALSLWLNAETDSSGRFVLEKVPPGERRISHRLKAESGVTGTMRLTQDVTIDVQPGETTYVALGGNARAVVGRVVVSGYSKPIHWASHVARLKYLRTDAGEPAPPRRDSFPTVEAFRAALELFQDAREKFRASQAGRELDRRPRSHIVGFDADGSFRINDVVAGRYALEIELTQSLHGSLGPARGPGSGPTIASLSRIIEVPETSSESPPEPLDLGLITLLPAKGP